MLPKKPPLKQPNLEDIIGLMKRPSKADIALVKKAYAFAEKAHEGQKRYSGEPYFNHAAHVGANLASIHVDATTVAAGLLHDTIEDAAVPPKPSKQSLAKKF
jgi:(p)ppGpp synthase/HD superfamily hydrolase